MDSNLDVKEEEVKLPEEPSTAEQTTEEVKEPEAEVATSEEETNTETEESNKGASQRIRELNAEKKAAEAEAKAARAEAKSLAQRLAEITEPIGSEQDKPAFTPQIEPGQEITPDQYKTDVSKTAEAIVEIRLKQERAVNRINTESIDAVRKYSQLDPQNDNFDKELSDSVTEAVEAHVRANPYSASVSKFVDKLMKPYIRSVAKEVGQATENIAKQVSETALRPTQVHKPEKSASDKSMAELEAELGTVYS